MKLAILNTWGSPAGGAALALHRLHHALRQQGIDSTLLVADEPPAQDSTVIQVADTRRRLARWAEKWVLRHYPKPWPSHSLNLLSRAAVVTHPVVRSADAVLLGWIGQNYISLRQLACLRQPVLWRLSDCWPFTGGCHYPGECRRFELTCGACPQLAACMPPGQSPRIHGVPTHHPGAEADPTRHQWRRKQRSYAALNLHIAAPSRWIQQLAGSSSLLQQRPIHLLPSGVDTSIFIPRDRADCRHRLGIPQDAHVLLFGAVQASRNPRKGGPLFHRALEILAGQPGLPAIHLAVFGDALDPTGADGPPAFPFPCTHVGRVGSDEALAHVYPAANLFVAPSIEDNLPNTVMEAMACSIPCVSFAVGGLTDLITPQSAGWLAASTDAASLAAVLHTAITAARRPPLPDPRDWILTHFDLATQARKYRALLETMVRTRG